MNDDALPKKIQDPGMVGATPSIQPGEERSLPEQGKFASLMQQTAEANPVRAPSPAEVAKVTPAAGQPTSQQSVLSQINGVSSSLGDVGNQLNTQNLKLKQSQKYLLRSKLENANDQIRGAVENLGGNPGDPVNLRAKKNPIAKFLSLVSDGQQQLTNAAELVNNLNSSGQGINPGQLLLVQVKLQKAQQELDYTSVLLGKAVDVIKTLFNVQI
jgi:hypothetical protein